MMPPKCPVGIFLGTSSSVLYFFTICRYSKNASATKIGNSRYCVVLMNAIVSTLIGDGIYTNFFKNPVKITLEYSVVYYNSSI